MTVKWTQVSSKPTAWRYEALSEELKLCGFENSFEATRTTEDQFGAAIESAKQNYEQIRVGAEFTEHALRYYPDLPADLLTLKAIDAFVPTLGAWWPRCFYFEGIVRTLVRDLKNLDLGSGVFIMGATWRTRVIVAALTRAGFNKVVISDVDEKRGQSLVRELRKLNFGSKFDFVQRSMVTQLPGISSIAINVLSLVEYPELVADLSYLNFLRPDGIWIETEPYAEESPLTVEAVSLGTQVEPAVHLLSNVDEAWAEKCFGVKIDLARYRESLKLTIKSHQ